VVALPGLTWSDVAAMPTLRGLMARGAVGSLTAKAGGTGTGCLTGGLTFAAGNRVEPAGNGCSAPAPGPGWAALRSANLHSEYAADIGALGSALQAAGVGTRALSPTARPLLANRDGVVGPAAGSSGRSVVADLDTALYRLPLTAPAAQRRVAAGSADRALHSALAGLGSDSTVIVTATADAGGQPALHPLVIAGPGWPHRELRFAGSHPPYTELIDLAPTILRALDVAIPDAMVGMPLRTTASSVRPVSAYLEENRHAQADESVQSTFLLALGWLTILLLLLAVTGARRQARFLARLLAPAPIVSFLVNLLPWWRWDRWVYAVGLALGCAAIATVTTLLAGRRPIAAVLGVPALSLAAVVGDQLAGAPMQLSSPLGYDPLDAGRFVGVGNLDFAVLAAAAVVVASVAGARLPRRQGLLLAAVVLAIAVVVDAAPPLGDDAGGLLALVPTAAVVLAVLAGVRLSVRRIAAVLGGTALLAVAVALADYSRPASSQTHIGIFVGQLLHGGGGTEVGRKAHAALATVGLTISSAVVVVAVVAGALRRERIREAVEADSGRLALLAGGVTVAVIGSALNDSGLNVAAMVLTVVVSALCSVQWPIRTPTRHDASISAPAVATTTSTASTDSPDSPGR
jgi:hypothetical protein